MSKVVVIGGGVIGCAEWSREVASTAGVDVDVRPQRGQLAALDPLDPGELVLRLSTCSVRRPDWTGDRRRAFDRRGDRRSQWSSRRAIIVKEFSWHPWLR
jgi:glycine/D-amino acid oxidase-like deaminating enzyme